MNNSFYLKKFQAAADQLSKKALEQKQLEVAVGVVLNSVFLKLYKRSWTNPGEDPLTATSRIFFSVWINDEAIAAERLYYNIHAFKLRHLQGYKIESRKFAESFRAGFKKEKTVWPNVSTHFGPLTLMEGWVNIDVENPEADMLNLSNKFFGISHLVDNTLSLFSK